jgi:hypothetical protein
MNLIAVIGLLSLSLFLVLVASFSPWLLAGCALISIAIASRSLIGWYYLIFFQLTVRHFASLRRSNKMKKIVGFFALVLIGAAGLARLQLRNGHLEISARLRPLKLKLYRSIQRGKKSPRDDLQKLADEQTATQLEDYLRVKGRQRSRP